MTKRQALRDIAEATVLRVRGSYDAPGFEICVLAELRKLEEKAKLISKREKRWACPLDYPGCLKNCGNYGCGN